MVIPDLYKYYVISVDNQNREVITKHYNFKSAVGECRKNRHLFGRSSKILKVAVDYDEEI